MTKNIYTKFLQKDSKFYNYYFIHKSQKHIIKISLYLEKNKFPLRKEAVIILL